MKRKIPHQARPVPKHSHFPGDTDSGGEPHGHQACPNWPRPCLAQTWGKGYEETGPSESWRGVLKQYGSLNRVLVCRHKQKNQEGALRGRASVTNMARLPFIRLRHHIEATQTVGSYFLHTC